MRIILISLFLSGCVTSIDSPSYQPSYYPGSPHWDIQNVSNDYRYNSGALHWGGYHDRFNF